MCWERIISRLSFMFTYPGVPNNLPPPLLILTPPHPHPIRLFSPFQLTPFYYLSFVVHGTLTIVSIQLLDNPSGSFLILPRYVFFIKSTVRVAPGTSSSLSTVRLNYKQPYLFYLRAITRYLYILLYIIATSYDLCLSGLKTLQCV